jgi:uncharacterized protein Smg (DUF494 family)
MTILDRFFDFARALPADRLGPVEDLLAAVMDTSDIANAFSADELAELDRRIAEPREYATQDEIAALFKRSQPR